METFRIRTATGADGRLNLSIPTSNSNTEFEVVIIVQPASKVPHRSPEELGYPSRFFEETAGSITDETFVRPPQCDICAARRVGPTPPAR